MSIDNFFLYMHVGFSTTAYFFIKSNFLTLIILYRYGHNGTRITIFLSLNFCMNITTHFISLLFFESMLSFEMFFY